VVSIFLWGKIAAFLDDAVPAVVGAVFVDFGFSHDEVNWRRIQGV
jgi:hypothetical protein